MRKYRRNDDRTKEELIVAIMSACKEELIYEFARKYLQSIKKDDLIYMQHQIRTPYDEGYPV